MEIDMDVDDGPVPQSVDVSDIKLEDEGDLDFQLALSKARKLKQKEKMKKQTGIEKVLFCYFISNIYFTSNLREDDNLCH